MLRGKFGVAPIRVSTLYSHTVSGIFSIRVGFGAKDFSVEGGKGEKKRKRKEIKKKQKENKSK
jgi:hypothetical protein